MWMNIILKWTSLKCVIWCLLVVLSLAINENDDNSSTLSTEIKIQDSLMKKADYLNNIYIRTWSVHPRPKGKRTMLLYDQQSVHRSPAFEGEGKENAHLSSPGQITGGRPVVQHLPYVSRDKRFDSRLKLAGDSNQNDNDPWQDFTRGIQSIKRRPGFSKRVWTPYRRPPSWTRALRPDTKVKSEKQKETSLKISDVLLKLRKLGIISWT